MLMTDGRRNRAVCLGCSRHNLFLKNYDDMNFTFHDSQNRTELRSPSDCSAPSWKSLTIFGGTSYESESVLLTYCAKLFRLVGTELENSCLFQISPFPI